MKKAIVIIISMIVMTSMICACENEIDSSKFEGKWQFCGIVEEGEEISADNAVTGEEFLQDFGLDEMPDASVTIDSNGLKELSDIPGSTAGKREDIDESCFMQKVTISTVDGKKLRKPITETVTFTLDGGYLFESSEYDDPEYDSCNTNVYKKIE